MLEIRKNNLIYTRTMRNVPVRTKPVQFHLHVFSMSLAFPYCQYSYTQKRNHIGLGCRDRREGSGEKNNCSCGEPNSQLTCWLQSDHTQMKIRQSSLNIPQNCLKRGFSYTLQQGSCNYSILLFQWGYFTHGSPSFKIQFNEVPVKVLFIRCT